MYFGMARGRACAALESIADGQAEIPLAHRPACLRRGRCSAPEPHSRRRRCASTARGRATPTASRSRSTTPPIPHAGPPADVGAGRLHDRVLDEGRAPPTTPAPAVACGAERRLEATATSSSTATAPALDRRFGVSIAGGVRRLRRQRRRHRRPHDLRLARRPRRALAPRGRRAAALGRLDVALRRRRPRGRGGRARTATSRIRTTRAPADPNDPFLVLGAEKYDAGFASTAYDGSPRRDPHLDAFCATRRLHAPATARSPPTPTRPPSTTSTRAPATRSSATPRAPPAAPPTAALRRRIAGRAPSGRPTAAPLGGSPAIMFTPACRRRSPRRCRWPTPTTDSARLFVVEQAGTIRIYKNGSAPARRRFSTSTRYVRRAAASRGCSRWRSIRTTRPTAISTSTTSNKHRHARRHHARPLQRVGAIPTSPTRPRPQILLVVPHPTNSNHNGGQLYLRPRTATSTSGPATGAAAAICRTTPRTSTSCSARCCASTSTARAPSPAASPRRALRRSRRPTPSWAAAGCDEVWAYGLRNPWRYSFDRGDATTCSSATSARTLYEEIDFQSAASTGGENYGWHKMEGFHCYNPSTNCDDGTLTLPDPRARRTPTAGARSSGGFRYRGAVIPALDGDLPVFRQLHWPDLARPSRPATGAGRRPSSIDSELTPSRASARTRPGSCTSPTTTGTVYRLTPSPNSVARPLPVSFRPPSSRATPPST